MPTSNIEVKSKVCFDLQKSSDARNQYVQNFLTRTDLQLHDFKESS